MNTNGMNINVFQKIEQYNKKIVLYQIDFKIQIV